MKTSRVPRKKTPAPAGAEQNIQAPPPSPNQKGRNQKSIYSSAAHAAIPREFTGVFPFRPGGPLLNRVGPPTAASDILNWVNAENQVEPSPSPEPKKLVPFRSNSGCYIPPDVPFNLRGPQFLKQTRPVNARPGTAVIAARTALIEQASDYSTRAIYHQKFVHGPSVSPASSGTSSLQQNEPEKKDYQPRTPSSPGDGVATARRPKKKKAKVPRKTVPDEKEAKLLEVKPLEVPSSPARIHVSRSEDTVNSSKFGQTFPPGSRGIRELPEWLVLAAQSKVAMANSANPISPLSSVSPVPPAFPFTTGGFQSTQVMVSDAPKIISTVKVTTPKTSRVSVMVHHKPNIPANPKVSSTSVSTSASQAKIQTTGEAKSPGQTSSGLIKPVSVPAAQSGTTIASRSKAKPTVRKPAQKKVDGKVFEGNAASKAIRSAVTAIKETPTPQRTKRIPDVPAIKLKSPAGSADNLKGKDSNTNSVTPSKPKKPAKGKAKKAGTKKSARLNTPTDEFLGSQHHIVDQQLRNLCERQKALEREVFILFEGLQNTFSGKCCNKEIKCCCNADTQEKMKALLQKQKEVIQLQIDLRKRYGVSPLGSATKLGQNEPLLDGFNAHFGQLASLAREIDGKMVYYCAACNVACDNELAFRRHVESTNHVMKTCKGIKSTQPIFTCDDCEAKMQGTTKYMSHVINSNVHNPRAQSSSSGNFE